MRPKYKVNKNPIGWFSPDLGQDIIEEPQFYANLGTGSYMGQKSAVCEELKKKSMISWFWSVIDWQKWYDMKHETPLPFTFPGFNNISISSMVDLWVTLESSALKGLYVNFWKF